MVLRNAFSSVTATPLDPRVVVGDLRVGRAHQVGDDLHQLGHHRFVDTEQSGRAHGPPDQPAQYVAAAFVAGGDAVGDQHDGRTAVVCDHAHPHIVDMSRAVSVLGAGRT